MRMRKRKKFVEDKKRTFQDFVDDMKKRGRSPSQVLAVASSTRWEKDLEDIKKYIKEIIRKSRIRKKLENS